LLRTASSNSIGSATGNLPKTRLKFPPPSFMIFNQASLIIPKRRVQIETKHARSERLRSDWTVDRLRTAFRPDHPKRGSVAWVIWVYAWHLHSLSTFETRDVPCATTISWATSRPIGHTCMPLHLAPPASWFRHGTPEIPQNSATIPPPFPKSQPL
jgi:hypothetical protein